MPRLLRGYLTETDLRAELPHLGRDVRVHASAIVHGDGLRAGSHVRIDSFALLIASGPLTLGDYVHVGPMCYLGARAGITMEDFAGLSGGVKIYTSSDDYSGASLTNPTVPRKYLRLHEAAVVLRRHVIIGAGTVILPGVTIGEGAAVGALSLVTRDLEPWTIYAGVPARRIKARQRDLLRLERELRASEP